MCHRFLVYFHLLYLHLPLISVPSLVYLGISVPWADIPITQQVRDLCDLEGLEPFEQYQPSTEEDSGEEPSGEESPAGNRWANHQVSTFLECGAAGALTMDRIQRRELSTFAIGWDLFESFLERGRHYE